MTETEAPRNAKAQAKADKAYAKANRPWYKKKRFWLLGIIVLIVLFTLMNQGDDATTTDETPTTSSQETTTPEATTEEPAAEEPAAPEEPDLTVTAQQMIEDLESNALGASNTYKDKRVTVTGKVENIDASGDYFTITGTEDFTLTTIRIDIEDEMVDTLASFTTGQDVTVTGTVTGVGEVMGYEIDAETIG